MRTAILFGRDGVRGTMGVLNGRLAGLRAESGTINGMQFELPRGGRLEVDLAEWTLKRGSHPTICQVKAGADSFSFHLRDVTSDCPIWIPEFKTAVVPAGDPRDYAAVADSVAARAPVSDFARFAAEPETSYADCALRNRAQYSHAWLGVGRDLRMFRVDRQEHFEYWGLIAPYHFAQAQALAPRAEAASQGAAPAPYHILFEIGHGASCRPRLSRRLDSSVLPILHALQVEQDLHYHITAFASLENEPLAPDAGRGSEWTACYRFSNGNMLSPEDKDALRDVIRAETVGREQELICCVRVEAVNTGAVPRYAWFKAGHVRPQGPVKLPDRHRFAGGCSSFQDAGTVYAVQRMDGEPMPDEEMAILIPPGGAVTFDLIVPHAPVSAARADALLKLDIPAHLEGCRAWWQSRLDSAASIEVPERPIQRSLQAGLLHCDLLALGREPDGPVLPTIGVYSPIGTESAPIIQYFDSVGWHDLAERCIQFFLERQRPDGFIQNFGRYESETGPFLWTVGEHYRYTLDTAWLNRIAPALRKACEYLLAWRERNKRDDLRTQGGYGMVNGKVADPNDFYHSFFLNAGTYLGLSRMAEVLPAADPDTARRLAAELPAYRADIRAGFYDALARAPVFPLGDGSWAPLLPPWVEHTGGISLYAEGGHWFSHGAFASRSCLTGPLWLILGEVLDPRERGADFLAKANEYPITLDNAALSQPYYCRHDFAHIRRGEVPAFLRAYYNQITALQDREILAFWEHYYHASPYKTHEQAWFLMQTRWMLWLEDQRTLRLLSAIPRAWLSEDREIRLHRVKSYFGPLSLRVHADPRRGRLEAELELDPARAPKTVVLRLPHPERRRAVACEGGRYDPGQETVTFPGTGGVSCVSLRF